MDIVLAHKRAGQLCDLTNIGFYSKTSFITAISEICRNAIEYATKGTIRFNVHSDGSLIEAVVSDKGTGIENVDYYLNRIYTPGIKGCGLQNARKLVDFFVVNTNENGTTVTLGMKTNSKSMPVSKAIINEWAEYFKAEKPASPYEEIKRQNDQLLEITDQLRIKNLETINQLEQIKKLNHQLIQSNQDLEDFASTLSHDLRSPIANLKMLVSIISNAKSAGSFDYISKLKSQVERLDDMILGLAEIIDLKNTQHVIASKVYFEDILAVVKEELKREIEATSAVIHATFSSRPYVYYYEVYVHSILMNLVSNAIKYRSDQTSNIRIKTAREDTSIVLTVEDNGIGMDMEKMGGELFKPFRRFSSNTEGKGIGLHIIKGMVEKNGGHIEVKSKPGKGTTFKIYLEEYI